MSVGDIFWFFFMFTAPSAGLASAYARSDAPLAKIAQLEKQRNSRVILLVHRQENHALFLGFPVVRYIDINDSEEILRAIQMTDNDVPP